MLTEITLVNLPIDRDQVEEALTPRFRGTARSQELARAGAVQSEALGRADRVLRFAGFAQVIVP
ncbi:hypothetical protein ABT174_36335 [Streptomyces sparsogenes]|uniref:hypothetical protein n=1 Tax=Streptomyces sparsogenes TaxID=67365 RepID=UPI00332243B3